MMKKSLLYSLFSLVTLVLFFLVLEISARVYVHFRRHTNEYEGLIEEQGIRADNKKMGELRVFLVGESAARGVPYEMESSVLGFLSRLIAELGQPQIKIINAAIPGKHSFWQREHAQTLLKYQPDAVILYAGNNDTRDFSNVMRDVPWAYFDFKLAWKSRFYWLLKKRIYNLEKSINKRLTRKVFEENRNQDDIWHWTDAYLKKKRAYLEDPVLGFARKRLALRDFEQNLNDLVAKLSKRGVRVFVVGLPLVHQNYPDIGDWPRKGMDFKQRIIFRSSEEEQTWHQSFEAGKKLLEEGEVENALVHFNQTYQINRTYPLLAHLMGQSYESIGQFKLAREYYVKGKDLQIQSPGGDTLKNEALRRIADRHKAVWVDVQSSLESFSENGITGRNLFLDHCHPNVLGHKIIAATLMQSFCESKFVSCLQENVLWNEWLQRLLGGGTAKENLTNEYLMTAFYYFNGSSWQMVPAYEEAITYLEMARKIVPSDKRIYPMLAASYWHKGNSEKAVESLDALKALDKNELKKALHDFPFLRERYEIRKA